MKKSGTLYIVATPIGNLEDITLRAIRILKEVELIACEDTRQTRKLLTRFEIRKKLISYYQPREKERIPYIIRSLKEGKDVALVSDSGTPGISDPGFPLIREAIKERIEVVPVPGASAITSALTASGLPTDRFLFIGFPPRKKEKLKKMIKVLKDEESTLVFFLPANRLLAFLELIQDTLGARQAVIAREMTKIHEEFLRGETGALIEILKEGVPKGEVTLLLSGRKKKEKKTNLPGNGRS
ncbi:MAG: 16S rRNA (cytidine(1402)-2'-O)-methyltransferase [Candidatus Aminicenantales bacterium]